jgi:hypothetical protein
VAISQKSNTTPSLCAAADLTPWLCELNAQLDGALADLAHTMQSVQSGTYARDANGQSFGLVQANFVPDATHLATLALERAAVTCFRSAIASFISFLDRLIAFQDLANEKVVVDHDITKLDDLYAPKFKGQSQDWNCCKRHKPIESQKTCPIPWSLGSLEECCPELLCAKALH